MMSDGMAGAAAAVRDSLTDVLETMRRVGYVWRLDQLARGEDIWTVQELQDFRRIARQIDGLLDVIDRGVGRDGSRKRVQTLVGDEGGYGAHGVPERLRSAYSMLCDAVYGTGRGDDDDRMADRASGTRGGKGTLGQGGWRLRSDAQGVGRGARPAKKFGSGKVVVHDEHALLFKQRIDKKLRRIYLEVEDYFLREAALRRGAAEAGDDEGGRRVRVCRECNKVGEDSWKYCPRCGGGMTWRK